MYRIKTLSNLAPNFTATPISHFTLQGNVFNLFDEKYYQSGQARSALPSMPLTGQISVRLRFQAYLLINQNCHTIKKMLLVIDNILTAEQLSYIRSIYSAAQFGDGRVTAGELAAQVKNNLQLATHAHETKMRTGMVHEALQRNALFVSAALPRLVCIPLIQPLWTRHGIWHSC